MKKIRLEKSNQTPNPLSQKRQSLNQESFSNTKADHRGPYVKAENSTSKAFFQNMKSELSTIKNDFQKLIRKEITLKPQQDPLKSTNSNKQRYNTSRRDNRSVSEFEKNDFITCHKGNEENRFFHLEKQFPCSSNSKQTISKTLQLRNQNKNNEHATFEYVEVKESKLAAQEKNNSKEIVSLKDKVRKLETELLMQRKDSELVKQELRIVSTEKTSLIVHVSELTKELKNQNQIIIENERDTDELKKVIQNLQQKNNNLFQESNDFNQERNHLNQQLEELSFHHNELRRIHQDVLGQNQHIRQQLDNLNRYCDELEHRSMSAEGDWKRKIEYLQKDIQTYQKRQDMFSLQIDQLKKSIQSAQPQSTEVISEDILALQCQIKHLTKQVQIEKQIHSNLAKRYESQANQSNNTADLIKTFEEKHSQLVEENGKLKTKINHMQASFESLTQQNRSYLEEIALYEQRERKQANRRQLNPTQWEQMTQKIQRLTQQNKRLNQEAVSKKTMQQTEANQFTIPENEKLLKLTHSQIAQIVQLKDKIIKLQIEITEQGRQMNNLKQTNSRMSNPANVQIQTLEAQLQNKEKKILKLKELIFSVIVKKTGKMEDQEELEHVLRKVQALRQNWN